MGRLIYCTDATLIVGDQQVAVEVDLGLLLPGDQMKWGGILRRLSLSLIDQLRGADAVCLRLPDCKERVIHPFEAIPCADDALLSVSFIGQGRPPF
ncbi:hypothetical protein ACF073_37205 [Streptomyces sp. NPDC015171]|uniref:hypothetical protein n=1 Tax=Streptomyces sp. NPDC015171 TaxID=3364945 RepID=UPI003702ABE7